MPTNSIRLTASASDPDGETLSYKWIKESGPEGEKILFSDQAESQVENLTEGVYVFRIVVFDDMKDQATDTVKVEVIDPNQAPNVSAGDDVELVLPQNSVTLKGDCQDADGVCVKVSWRYMHTSLQDLDEKQFQQVGSELMLTDLQVGTYDFVFIGEDDLGSQSSDDVRVVVKDAQQLASR